MGGRKYFRERHDPSRAPTSLALTEVKKHLAGTVEGVAMSARARLGGAFQLELRTQVGLNFEAVSFSMWAAGRIEAEYFSILEFLWDRAWDAQLSLFADSVNSVLAYYGDGYKFDDNGYIVSTGKAGLAELLEREAPEELNEGDRTKVDQAILQFRHRSATRETKKQAVQDLGDILESLKEKGLAKTVPHDEQDQIFHFVNKFKIRHHKSDQNDEYEDEYLEWMFVRALATVHLYFDLKAKEGEA